MLRFDSHLLLPITLTVPTAAQIPMNNMNPCVGKAAIRDINAFVHALQDPSHLATLFLTSNSLHLRGDHVDGLSCLPLLQGLANAGDDLQAQAQSVGHLVSDELHTPEDRK